MTFKKITILFLLAILVASVSCGAVGSSCGCEREKVSWSKLLKNEPRKIQEAQKKLQRAFKKFNIEDSKREERRTQK